ncbi:DNA-binding CsgD family transcriptional regulator [Microbacterium sp. SORGH_AS 888]|nr:LuxR C-terminal-related transcriptional regulator [Microbacterium sp. SORGH_AS_0888]MDQ1131187.1 DNA-binding CsgD family transcriptional regulator [Microbacterium sp. SORGH_AS_0888]
MVSVGTQSTSQLVSRAVSDLARRTRFPIAFGGLAEAGEIHVSSIVGARSHSIEGLVVRAERGLGGRAFVEGRPRLALDYRTARGITHDYDRAILGEGIATLFAVPVVAGGRTRGVLYCGSWSQAGLDASVAQPALRVAEELATELRIRDEVDRRVAMATPRTEQGLPAATREELRESYASLRSIAADVADPALRARIAAVEERIASLTAEPAERAATADVRLSPRELDVLSHAAMGATNAEISEALGLRETTVKSYLATAMAKFDASTRHAAVTAARRAGLLP